MPGIRLARPIVWDDEIVAYALSYANQIVDPKSTIKYLECLY